MEPYYALIDLRIFLSPAYLELSNDAQSRFTQLVGTCDRMGVANLYQIWNDGRIKADLMETLYKSNLVWEVDAYYCFIPVVFNANRKVRTGKYKTSFDVQGFQTCVNKYPILVDSMEESELEFIKSSGIIISKQLPSQYNETPAIVYKPKASTFEDQNPDEFINFNGILMNRKDHSRYLSVSVIAKQLESQYNAKALSKEEIIDWFMNIYQNKYSYNGTAITDLPALFTAYWIKVMQNKQINGTLEYRKVIR